MMHHFLRLFMTLVTPLEIVYGGTAKSSLITLGADSSVTCLAFKRDVSGRKIGNTLNQTKWCSLWITNSHKLYGLLGRLQLLTLELMDASEMLPSRSRNRYTFEQ